MRERLTSIIAVLLLVVLVGLSYWYSLKAERESELHLSDLRAPDFIANNIAIIKYDEHGLANAKVFADKVVHYSDGHADATSPKYFSLNPQEPQVTAKSDTAKMQKGGEVINFYDNVVINQAASKDNPPSKVETSRLDAYPDTNIYSSEKPVKITRGDDVSTGVGLDFDNVERTFKLRSQVHTTIQPKTVKEAEHK